MNPRCHQPLSSGVLTEVHPPPLHCKVAVKSVDYPPHPSLYTPRWSTTGGTPPPVLLLPYTEQSQIALVDLLRTRLIDYHMILLYALNCFSRRLKVELYGERVKLSGERVELYGERVELHAERVELYAERAINCTEGLQRRARGARMEMNGSTVTTRPMVGRLNNLYKSTDTEQGEGERKRGERGEVDGVGGREEEGRGQHSNHQTHGREME